MILWTCLILSTTVKKTFCGKGDGGFVINYRVHVNEPAHLSINNYMRKKHKKNYDGQQAVEEHFNDIFEAVNMVLAKFKVRVVGDYSQLQLDKLPIYLTQENACKTNNAVGLLTNAAKITLGWPATQGIGNRIIVYKCATGVSEQKPFMVERIDDCGHIGVVHMGTAEDYIKIIMDIVEESLTYDKSDTSNPNEKEYINHLCDYVESCAVGNDYIGVYALDYLSRNVTSEEITSENVDDIEKIN